MEHNHKMNEMPIHATTWINLGNKLCSVKEARHKKSHIVWFHAYEMSIIGKSKEIDSRESTCNAGNMDSILGLGRSPCRREWLALQYSCLENPMDRGAWRAIVHEVAKSVK